MSCNFLIREHHHRFPLYPSCYHRGPLHSLRIEKTRPEGLAKRIHGLCLKRQLREEGAFGNKYSRFIAVLLRHQIIRFHKWVVIDPLSTCALVVPSSFYNKQDSDRFSVATSIRLSRFCAKISSYRPALQQKRYEKPHGPRSSKIQQSKNFKSHFSIYSSKSLPALLNTYSTGFPSPAKYTMVMPDESSTSNNRLSSSAQSHTTTQESLFGIKIRE